MKVVSVPLLLLLAGVITAAEPTPGPHAATVRSCRPSGLGGADIIRWVKRTITDTSSYAQANRTMSGLSLGDSSAVVMIVDSAVCADLALRFAREVTGRDTVNVANVYAVAIGTASWVVSDFTPLEPLVDSVSTGTPVLATGPQVMPTVTVDQSSSAAKVWNFPYLRPAGAKY